MSYSDFLSLIPARVRERLEGDPVITVRPILKNNGLKLDSLLILYPGENICPTIYLNPYYEAWKSGVPLDELLDEILDFYRAHHCPESFDLSLFHDFKKAESHIFLRLISRRANPELLSDFPHVPFLDLAAVFFLSVSDSLLGDSTVLIHKKHLELWGVSPEALYDLALENTRREYGVSLTPLAIAAGRTDPPSFISSIFVFTNRARAFGAACLLYDDVLRDFSDRHGSFYVLPSSIHETILVPEKSGATPAFLSDMVRQVNENDVAPEEVLSDQIYYYRKDEKRLGMILAPGCVRFPLRPAGRL